MNKIKIITICHIPDYDADLSYIGKYTDELTDGVIVREFGEFYEDLTEEQKEDIPEYSREMRGFKPVGGGEPVGSADYKKYGKQDYELMQKIERGDVSFIGIKAEAEILVSLNDHWITQSISSGGLWGIDVDSSEETEYIKEIQQEQLSELLDISKALGFTEEQFKAIEPKVKQG